MQVALIRSMYIQYSALESFDELRIHAFRQYRIPGPTDIKMVEAFDKGKFLATCMTQSQPDE
jgi:hypothetical protein